MTQSLGEALLKHFMYQKLEISFAIRKPFPFFEGLRDKSFISERTYKESLEACRNLVPVSNVVYNILTKLEDTFSLSFLQLLFSQINLREYPGLMTIFKSFKSVVASHGGLSKATLTLLETPGNTLERSSCQTLLSLPPPQHPSPRHLTPVPRISAPGASSQHVAEVLGEPSRPTSSARALLTVTQKERVTPVTNLTIHINDEDLQQMPSTPSTTMQMIRSDSPEPNNAKELQEVSCAASSKKRKKRKIYGWSTPRKRHKKKSVPRGTASPGLEIQEELQEVNQVAQRKNNSTWNAEVVTMGQTSGLEEVSDDASETNEENRSWELPRIPPRIMQDFLDSRSKVSVGKLSGEKQKKKKKISQSSSKRKHKKSLPKGTTSPEHRIQGKLQLADQATQRKDNSTRSSKMVTRAQKAKTKYTQTSELEGKACDRNCHLKVQCGSISQAALTELGGWICEVNGRRREKCRQDGHEGIARRTASQRRDVESS